MMPEIKITEGKGPNTAFKPLFKHFKRMNIDPFYNRWKRVDIPRKEVGRGFDMEYPLLIHDFATDEVVDDVRSVLNYDAKYNRLYFTLGDDGKEKSEVMRFKRFLFGPLSDNKIEIAKIPSTLKDEYHIKLDILHWKLQKDHR